MQDDGASHASAEAEEGTADELVARLLQGDEQLAKLLSTAGAALRALLPDASGEDGARRGEQDGDAFSTNMQQWFATLNVCNVCDSS